MDRTITSTLEMLETLIEANLKKGAKDLALENLHNIRLLFSEELNNAQDEVSNKEITEVVSIFGSLRSLIQKNTLEGKRLLSNISTQQEIDDILDQLKTFR
jgi:hypothetical protein